MQSTARPRTFRLSRTSRERAGSLATRRAHGESGPRRVSPSQSHKPRGTEGSGVTATVTGLTPVTFTATVTKVEGPLVEFDVVAHDGLEEVGRGKHGRFMVPVDKLAERIKSKIAKFKNG